jgi:hypothetical protein
MKTLNQLSHLLCFVSENIVDSDNVLSILIFIALTNCLRSGGKVVFVMRSKYHLRIDLGQSCCFVFFMCNKNTMLLSRA